MKHAAFSLGRPALSVAIIACLAIESGAQGILYEWPVQPGQNRVSPAGDIDNDGVLDFALGQPGSGNITDVGRLRVFSGRDGALILDVPGATPGDRFGREIVGIGDVDSDGHADVAVSNTSVPFAGLGGDVSVVSGATGAILWKVASPGPRLNFGVALARIDDLDLDGVAELVVGAPGFINSRVSVYSGASGILLRESIAPAGSTFAFGSAVDAGGDFNFDNVPDFIVGDAASNSGPGRVTVHSGVDAAILLAIDSPRDGDFGSSIAVVPDVTGDQIPEILIAAPTETVVAGLNTGRVRLYSGANGSLLKRFYEPGPVIGFGSRVAAFGDLDGDGRSDLAIAAGLRKTGCCLFVIGELRVYSSATGNVLFAAPGHSLNFTVVPDADADGIVDYLVPNIFLSGFSVALALTGAEPPARVTTCPAKKTSTNCSPALFFEGALSLTKGKDLTVRAAHVIENTVGMFVWSPIGAALPFGGGTLCASPPLQRSPMLPATGGEQPCAGSISPTGTLQYTWSKAQLAALGLPPGKDFFVQAWFRDPGFAPPNDIGLSDAFQFFTWP